MKNTLTLSVIALTLPFLSACQNPVTKAAHKIEYSAYELVGIQKRDLLKTRVDDAKEEQQEASKEFKDALDQLKSIYGFSGGKLENEYDSLKSSYDDSVHRAENVHKAVKKVEYVAQDLFEEWQKEITQIETTSLRQKSQESLGQTQRKYEELHKILKSSEARMDPILHKLNDMVLFLKHNLNAKAIGSLKSENKKIQSDIESLITQMNKSIDSADQFIKEMP